MTDTLPATLLQSWKSITKLELRGLMTRLNVEDTRLPEFTDEMLVINMNSEAVLTATPDGTGRFTLELRGKP